jgi:type I restriction enzyme S subunit
MTYSGNCRLGDLFTSRREKGRPGLPTLSVTLNDGLVNREDMERKQDTSLAPEEHLLVKPGDIAYNMMRMWQGAFGLADREGLVSPAYVVLKVKKDIDPLYASYLFKTARMKYLFWAYSYGLTDDRLRLYYPDFSRIPLAMPGRKEQERVAKLIGVWDDAIDTADRLIHNGRRQKIALLQKLLPGPHDHSSLTAGWNVARMSDLVDLSPRKSPRPKDGRVSFIPMEAVSEDGHIRRTDERDYESVSTGYSSFCDGDILVAKITPCFENGKGALVSGLCNGVGFGSTEFHVLRPRGGSCPELIKHIVGSHEFRRRGETEMEGSAGQKRVSADFIRTFRFACPDSLEGQRKIAMMLSVADNEIKAYTSYAQSLRQERDALAQRLFPIAAHAVRGIPVHPMGIA